MQAHTSLNKQALKSARQKKAVQEAEVVVPASGFCKGYMRRGGKDLRNNRKPYTAADWARDLKRMNEYEAPVPYVLEK